MKRLSLLIILCMFLFGCMEVPEITESEAVAFIEQLHTNSFGTAKVISTTVLGVTQWSGKTKGIANGASITSMEMMAG